MASNGNTQNSAWVNVLNYFAPPLKRIQIAKPVNCKCSLCSHIENKIFFSFMKTNWTTNITKNSIFKITQCICSAITSVVACSVLKPQWHLQACRKQNNPTLSWIIITDLCIKETYTISLKKCLRTQKWQKVKSKSLIKNVLFNRINAST